MLVNNFQWAISLNFTSVLCEAAGARSKGKASRRMWVKFRHMSDPKYSIYLTRVSQIPTWDTKTLLLWLKHCISTLPWRTGGFLCERSKYTVVLSGGYLVLCLRLHFFLRNTHHSKHTLLSEVTSWGEDAHFSHHNLLCKALLQDLCGAWLLNCNHNPNW